MPVSDVVDRLSALASNPRLLGRGINRLYYRATRGQSNPDGVEVFDADWDTLVLLDACRYDLFASTDGLPGTLERRQSKASNTLGFLRANVATRDLRDTVYVTANPQFRTIEDELGTQFHAVVDLWDHGWDEAMHTVLPETVTTEAVATAEEYPNKRLFVHYNQPHVPFVGPTGRERFDLEAITGHELPFWQQPMASEWDLDKSEIWDAYRENLEVVLPHVERLLETVRGKTVVTSDHGNMIGESSAPVPVTEYGHPSGIYTPELVTVPWLVHLRGDRKRVVTESAATAQQDTNGNTRIEDRLKHLGYKKQ
jgi:hypothetical protein